MATQFEPSDVLLVRNQIIVDGQVAFTAGEKVVVEAVEPNPTRPQYKYIVYSKNLGKRFQLSDDDVSTIPGEKPESIEKAEEPTHEDGATAAVAENDAQVSEYDCMHRYERSSDGSLICRKCGANVAQTGERLPNIPTSCAGCGNTLSDSSIVCGACGAPNVHLIERTANLENRSSKGCRHSYRYMPHQQKKICINCARIIPLKTPVQRRKYATALGESLCIYCGAKKIKGKRICETCGREYAEIDLLPQKEYDPKRVRIRTSTAQLSTNWYRRPPETRPKDHSEVSIVSPRGHIVSKRSEQVIFCLMAITVVLLTASITYFVLFGIAKSKGKMTTYDNPTQGDIHFFLTHRNDSKKGAVFGVLALVSFVTMIMVGAAIFLDEFRDGFAHRHQNSPYPRGPDIVPAQTQPHEQVTAKAESIEVRSCPSCGFEVKAEGVVFCPECGGDMSTA